jgi:hypothetical protein
MPPQRPLFEKVLDLVVYAPVGLALQLRVDVPTLVASGRTRVHERVQVARWVGEMAVTYGKQTIERRMAGEATPVPPPIERRGQGVAAVTARTDSAHRSPPFEGYDHLAAAQIVQLLGRLPHGELELIRDYEASQRGRRTILAKLGQLIGE